VRPGRSLALALVATMGLAAPAAAGGQDAEASAAYACLLAQENLEVLTTPVDATLVLRLDIPTHVEAGDRITPAGIASVTLPEAQRQVLALTSADLQVHTPMLAVRAVADTGSTPLPAAWSSAPAATTSGGPLTLSGPVRLPAYDVTDTDEVELRLPDENVLPPLLGDSPVALNLEATGTGRLGGTTTYFLSCRAVEGAGGRAVTVPVSAGPEHVTPATEDVTEELPPQVDLPAMPGSSAPALVAAPGAAPAAASPVAGDPTPPVTQEEGWDWASPAAAAPADGVLVRPAVLGWVTFLLTALALAHAAWSTWRLRVLRAARSGAPASGRLRA
jgi:hypothetical protein